MPTWRPHMRGIQEDDGCLCDDAQEMPGDDHEWCLQASPGRRERGVRRPRRKPSSGSGALFADPSNSRRLRVALHALYHEGGAAQTTQPASSSPATDFPPGVGSGGDSQGGLTGPRLARAQRTFSLLYPDGEVYCPYCGEPAELLRGSEADELLHRSRRRSDSPVWACVGCNACVGCHTGTEMPLGTLADPATRASRVAAHAAFDSLWKQGDAPDGETPPMTRGAAYDWMAATLGIDPALAHIAALDRYQCEDLCESVQELWSPVALGGDGIDATIPSV